MDDSVKKALLHQMPAGIAVFRLETDGYVPLFVNDDILEKSGSTGAELARALSGDVSLIVHPEDAERVALMLYKSGVTGGMFSETVRLRLKGGGYSWTDVHLNSVQEETGTYLLSFTLNDVNTQKENELRLERTYEELLGVMNNTPGGIVVFDTKNNREPFPTFVSTGMYRLLEGSKADVTALYSKDFYSCIHPGDRENVIRAMEEAIRNLSPFQITVRLRAVTGNYVWVDANGTVELTEGLRRVYVSFTYSSADRETQRILKNILDMFAREQYDNICLVDSEKRTFRILSFNNDEDYFVPEKGGNYDEVVSDLILRFVIEEDRERIFNELNLDVLSEKLKAEGETEHYFSIRNMSGNVHYKKLWARRLENEGGSFALVMSDCTELRRRQIESQKTLVDAMEAAKQANVAKSVFLSRMSHDIRTPLNAIIGFTKIGLDDPDCGESGRERLEKIETASEYLLSLVNDVLDMSRIESGKFNLKKEPFDMNGFIDGICAVISQQCVAKGLKLTCSAAENLRPLYVGDSLKLQQVLMNIMGNAVKFTPSGGEISVLAEETASYAGHAMLRFTVADTGVGISEEFIPHLFEPFTQESGDAGQPGTGLGLAICKSIVSLMGGSIEVKSQKGKGTRFVISVQLGILADENSNIGKVPAKEKKIPGTSYDFTGKRVLLAEDNVLNQEIAKYILESVGVKTDVADNGEEACNRFSKSAAGYFDAVLLDIRMPVMDGITAAVTIRAMARPDAGTVPLIAVSADAFEEDISRSLSSGINAHLIKPLDRDLLCSTLFDFWSETL